MLQKIWNNRKQILEGLTNSVFIKAEVESIAGERGDICHQCESYDTDGEGCEVPGTAPCCSKLNGGCGCVISIKIRALSSACPKDYWPAIMSDEEADKLVNN